MRINSRDRPSLHPLKPLRTYLLLAAVAVALSACRKEDRFTDEPGIQLVFSRDTVLFDTIFTTVGSVTKRFTARNPHANAVRVQIALLGGAPSPFRINVDGASGTSFSDVEILGGDSIYVFVEAELGPGGANTPFVIEDHIVFNTNGTEQRVLLAAWGQDAHFHRPGPDSLQIPGFPRFGIVAGGKDENGQIICETVTWTSDKPHVIYGYAVVDSCSTLIIEPGTRVHVHGGGGLWVYRWGKVHALGTLEQPITFQSDRLEPLYAELPGQWDRIWINEGPLGNDNLFEHVLIKNALVGIQCETFPLFPLEPTSAAKLVLNNVHIRNCSAAGILSRNYAIESNNLLVGDCGQHSIALTGGGNYYFNHTTVANYWDYELRQTPAFIMTNTTVDINGTLQVRPIVNSVFENGIIHGANGNEFKIEVDSDAPTDYRFRYFLLRTDQNTNDPDHFGPELFRNQDPGFVSSSDRNFRLTQGSFARNKGTSSTIEAITDIEGKLRNCDGSGFDLGAYEWCP
jgi:hypothetical protein